jgi:hypothetical protein
MMEMKTGGILELWKIGKFQNWMEININNFQNEENTHIFLVS